jgi:hypothetical protein
MFLLTPHAIECYIVSGDHDPTDQLESAKCSVRVTLMNSLSA